MEKEKYIISFSDSDGISNLDTYPQMPADALKRQFDQKSDKLKDAHNALVDRIAVEFAAEAATRGAAIAKETEERNKALSTEAEARSAAIAKETQERNKALSTEAEARGEAIEGLKAEINTKADAQTENGGFVVGQGATSIAAGVAIGANSKSIGNGAAVGVRSRAVTGGAVGRYANTEGGGAVGNFAVSGDGFAGGNFAKAIDSDGTGINAIQLGTGTNNKEKTLQVYDRTIVEYDGSGRDSAEKWYLSDVGKLKELATVAKENVVSAVNEVVLSVGDIETVLDAILELQENLIGGEK